MKRPTYREITKKLKQACTFVKKGQVPLINQTPLAVDALELEYSITLDLLEVLTELLDKTDPSHYTGSRPPQRSYEDEISGLDLFAFVVEIERFSHPVYYKFSVSEDGLWLVSLHKDRKNKEVP
ncbi:MAG: hypothetical protein U9P10_00345 [Thermodesulfobacteriota bacterium]|nr:hypothetical protein [Thermodesulfobacteriota bacterium]